MPKIRLSLEEWFLLRREIWERDGKQCVRCHTRIELDTCHIDHIKSGKRADNSRGNLRTLCRRCHVLRADNRHRGMMAKAIEDGIIPPDWRHLVWEG